MSRRSSSVYIALVPSHVDASEAVESAECALLITPKRRTGGALEFTDGYPTRETAARLRDHIDYLHGVEAFMNTIQGVSNYAVRQGFLNAGVMDATYSSSPS